MPASPHTLLAVPCSKEPDPTLGLTHTCQWTPAAPSIPAHRQLDPLVLATPTAAQASATPGLALPSALRVLYATWRLLATSERCVSHPLCPVPGVGQPSSHLPACPSRGQGRLSQRLAQGWPPSTTPHPQAQALRTAELASSTADGGAPPLPVSSTGRVAPSAGCKSPEGIVHSWGPGRPVGTHAGLATSLTPEVWVTSTNGAAGD